MTTFEGPSLDSTPGIGPLTLGGFLGRVVADHARNEALVFDDALLDNSTVRWTYRDLDEHARAIAAGLVARGVGLGSRVGIVMGNRPEAVASIFAVGLVGGVTVPLSTFSTTSELRDLIERSAVAGVLTQARLQKRLFGAEIDGFVADPGLPFLGWSASVGELSWTDLLRSGEAVDTELVDRRAGTVTPGDPGLILFSSGTTAAPKGMIHLHRAPTLQFWLHADIFRRTADARVWAPLPLFWTAGLTTALGPTLAAGGCVVLQEVFDAGRALHLIERERVTEPYTLPHHATALAQHPNWSTTDLSSLREVYGKSVFTRHPSVSGDTTWNMPVAYGMSETCASVAGHRWDTPRSEMKASIGRLLPGVRLRVVDPETGEELGIDQDGELALAGPTVLDRYVGMTREETFGPDGFLLTGDMGRVDALGDVHWTGRRTEMIKTAGANVSPAEIEVALRACPDVRRARVVGLPDHGLGEIVTLCVELVEGAEADADHLRAFLADRIATYKVPRRVLFFAPGELPTTGSDAKVRDDELIAIAAARLAPASTPRHIEDPS
jgi:acyl-CoA synthetase (AMP-forming)/AMP-acid ligase II